MAWTDACKIEGVAQVDHKIKTQGVSVTKACNLVAKEDGSLPMETIRDWYKKAKGMKTGENSPKKKKEPKASLIR